MRYDVRPRMRYDVDSIENRDPAAIERTVSFLEPLLERFFHPDVRGFDRIPSGPGLYVANHNGGILLFDAYILGCALYRNCATADLPYALAHDLAVLPPVAHELLVPLGAVRASQKNARKLFRAGRKVLVFPGGDKEAFRPFSARDRIVFGERHGYVRLALREGVPIIPCVTAGAHSAFVVLDDGGRIAKSLLLDRLFRVNVFPIVLSAPWGLTIGFPPPYLPLPTQVVTEILPPIQFERSGPDAAQDREYVEHCHRRVVTTMQDALTRLGQERRRERRALIGGVVEHLAERLGLPLRGILSSG